MIIPKKQSGFALPIAILIAIVLVLIVAGGAGYYFDKISQEKEEFGERSEMEKISELKPLDETWNTYINHELGFSMKVPKEIMHSYGSCRWVDSEKSYRPKEASVPVKIFEDEDNKIVYVTSEYFYVLGGETRKDYVSYFSECNKTFNSIELLELPKDGCEQSHYQHCWKIVTRDITDDKELEEFIKEYYGFGCSLGEKRLTRQEGVYDVGIEGDGKDLEFTECPMTYGVVLKYYPEKNKVISWRFGIQSPTFYKDYNLGGEYDTEMIKSLRIEKEIKELEESEEASKVKERPSITVLSPNGGEKWEIRKDYNITWASKGIDTVEVDLYKAGKLFDSLIITSADLGKCSWNVYIKTISELPGDKYKIRVFDYSNPETYDESDDFFSIKIACPLPETPILTDPGISVNSGESFALNWTGPIGGTLQRDIDPTFPNPIGIYTAQSLSLSLSPAKTTTYYYRFNACNNCGCIHSNIVDIQVIVVPPTIAIISPNGGESINQESCKIQWDSKDVELIDILLLVYDENKNQLLCYHNPLGTGFVVISEVPIAAFKQGAKAEDGYYLASFKQELEENCSFVIPPSYYKIKLRESYANETVDTSDGYFTISPAPMFKIISINDEVQLRGEINPLNWENHTFTIGDDIILTDNSTKFYLDGKETTFEELKQLYDEMGKNKYCPFGSCPFNSLNGDIKAISSQGQITIIAKEMFFSGGQ